MPRSSRGSSFEQHFSKFDRAIFGLYYAQNKHQAGWFRTILLGSFILQFLQLVSPAFNTKDPPYWQQVLIGIANLKISDITFMYVIFSIVCVYICASLTIAVVVAILFQQNHLVAIWPLHLCRILTTSSATFLYMPCLHVLFNTFACEPNADGVLVHVFSPSVQCWAFPHLGASLCSLVIMAVFIPFALFSSLLIFNPSPKKAGFLGRQSGRFDCFVLVMKLSIVFTARLSSSQPASMIVECSAMLLLIVVAIYMQPYYMFASNVMCPMYYCIVGVCVFFLHLTNLGVEPSALFFLGFAAAVLALPAFVGFLSAMRARRLWLLRRAPCRMFLQELLQRAESKPGRRASPRTGRGLQAPPSGRLRRRRGGLSARGGGALASARDASGSGSQPSPPGSEPNTGRETQRTGRPGRTVRSPPLDPIPAATYKLRASGVAFASEMDIERSVRFLRFKKYRTPETLQFCAEVFRAALQRTEFQRSTRVLISYALFLEEYLRDTERARAALRTAWLNHPNLDMRFVIYWKSTDFEVGSDELMQGKNIMHVFALKRHFQMSSAQHASAAKHLDHVYGLLQRPVEEVDVRLLQRELVAAIEQGDRATGHYLSLISQTESSRLLRDFANLQQMFQNRAEAAELAAWANAIEEARKEDPDAVPTSATGEGGGQAKHHSAVPNTEGGSFAERFQVARLPCQDLPGRENTQKSPPITRFRWMLVLSVLACLVALNAALALAYSSYADLETVAGHASGLFDLTSASEQIALTVRLLRLGALDSEGALGNVSSVASFARLGDLAATFHTALARLFLESPTAATWQETVDVWHFVVTGARVVNATKQPTRLLDFALEFSERAALLAEIPSIAHLASDAWIGEVMYLLTNGPIDLASRLPSFSSLFAREFSTQHSSTNNMMWSLFLLPQIVVLVLFTLLFCLTLRRLAADRSRSLVTLLQLPACISRMRSMEMKHLFQAFDGDDLGSSDRLASPSASPSGGSPRMFDLADAPPSARHDSPRVTNALPLSLPTSDHPPPKPGAPPVLPQLPSGRPGALPVLDQPMLDLPNPALGSTASIPPLSDLPLAAPPLPQLGNGALPPLPALPGLPAMPALPELPALPALDGGLPALPALPVLASDVPVPALPAVVSSDLPPLPALGDGLPPLPAIASDLLPLPPAPALPAALGEPAALDSDLPSLPPLGAGLPSPPLPASPWHPSRHPSRRAASPTSSSIVVGPPLGMLPAFPAIDDLDTPSSPSSASLLDASLNRTSPRRHPIHPPRLASTFSSPLRFGTRPGVSPSSALGGLPPLTPVNELPASETPELPSPPDTPLSASSTPSPPSPRPARTSNRERPASRAGNAPRALRLVRTLSEAVSPGDDVESGPTRGQHIHGARAPKPPKLSSASKARERSPPTPTVDSLDGTPELVPSMQLRHTDALQLPPQSDEEEDGPAPIRPAAPPRTPPRSPFATPASSPPASPCTSACPSTPSSSFGSPSVGKSQGSASRSRSRSRSSQNSCSLPPRRIRSASTSATTTPPASSDLLHLSPLPARASAGSQSHAPISCDSECSDSRSFMLQVTASVAASSALSLYNGQPSIPSSPGTRLVTHQEWESDRSGPAPPSLDDTFTNIAELSKERATVLVSESTLQPGARLEGRGNKSAGPFGDMALSPLPTSTRSRLSNRGTPKITKRTLPADFLRKIRQRSYVSPRVVATFLTGMALVLVCMLAVVVLHTAFLSITSKLMEMTATASLSRILHTLGILTVQSAANRTLCAAPNETGMLVTDPHGASACTLGLLTDSRPAIQAAVHAGAVRANALFQALRTGTASFAWPATSASALALLGDSSGVEGLTFRLEAISGLGALLNTTGSCLAANASLCTPGRLGPAGPAQFSLTTLLETYLATCESLTSGPFPPNATQLGFVARALRYDLDLGLKHMQGLLLANAQQNSRALATMMATEITLFNFVVGLIYWIFCRPSIKRLKRAGDMTHRLIRIFPELDRKR